MQILPSRLGQSISESERSDRLILRHTRGRVTETNHDVAYGSWLCENTLARDCDSINISQRALLGTRSVAGRYYFGGLRKIILAASQIFAFLHSQGHSQPSLPAPAHPDVSYAPNCDQRIAAPRFDEMGQTRK